MQGLLGREAPLPRHACQPQQQQRRQRHGRHQHHRAEIPPRLEVVVDHAGEALKVVIAEKAVPERLTFHQQLEGVPGQADRSGDRQTGERPQPAPGGGQITAQPAEQKHGEAGQHHSHRSFGQNGQPQHQPGWPPALVLGIGKTSPLQQQTDGQQTAEQRVADGGPAPDDHQGRQAEGQGGDPGGQSRASAGLLRPPQQGVGQSEHHRNAGQG